MAALRKAAVLASQLNARITLLHPQTVPFPLTIESPPVLLEFSEQRLRQIACESPVETTVQIYHCRDQLETLKTILAPGSVVVIGGRRGWWPNEERRMARQLRRAGHQVIYTKTESRNA